MADVGSSRTNPLYTGASEALRLRYTDGAHNAEALMVHPQTGDIYVITKTSATRAKVYKAKAPFDSSTVISLNLVSKISVPGKVTGADISPDGLRVVLCDCLSAYEISLPLTSSDFDAIWKEPALMIPLGPREQGEAVCYRLDGNAILATSENTPTPLIEVVRNNWASTKRRDQGLERPRTASGRLECRRTAGGASKTAVKTVTAQVAAAF